MRTRLYIWGLFCCLLAFNNLQGQSQQANPFELTPRLKEKPVADDKVEAPEEAANPFDLVAPDKEKISIPTPILPIQKEKTDQPFGSNSFLLGVILFGLILMAVLVTTLRPFINKCYRAVLNENMLNQIYRERETGTFTPYFLLYISFFIQAGIFLFLIFRHHELSFQTSPFLLLLGCILLIAVLFFLKHLLLAIVGNIFPISKETRVYSFTIMVYSIILGLLLAPANLMTAYAPVDSIRYFIIASLVMIVALYVVRAFRGLLLANNYLRFHIFHFLLYICTVEIVPILVLYKMITNQLG